MALAETIRHDLLALIEDDPVTFQFEGVEYVGASSGIAARRPLEIGGFEEQPELTIVINLRRAEGDATFGQDMPQDGDRITVGERVYRVDRTEIDTHRECLQMDLRSPHK